MEDVVCVGDARFQSFRHICDCGRVQNPIRQDSVGNARPTPRHCRVPHSVRASVMGVRIGRGNRSVDGGQVVAGHRARSPPRFSGQSVQVEIGQRSGKAHVRQCHERTGRWRGHGCSACRCHESTAHCSCGPSAGQLCARAAGQRCHRVQPHHARRSASPGQPGFGEISGVVRKLGQRGSVGACMQLPRSKTPRASLSR